MKKAALVLSGGGALGIALIGILEELEKKGYEFDYIAGVSAGAIVSACIAYGLKSQEIWEIIHDTKLFKIAFDFSITKFGIISGDKALLKLQEIFGDMQIEDLKIPLKIGATNFQTGERVIFSSGSLAEAVRCSLSVPVLFNPYFHTQQKIWCVDGGLSQNFPLDLAISEYQGDKIFGVDVSSSIDDMRAVTSAKEIKFVKSSDLVKVVK